MIYKLQVLKETKPRQSMPTAGEPPAKRGRGRKSEPVHKELFANEDTKKETENQAEPEAKQKLESTEQVGEPPANRGRGRKSGPILDISKEDTENQTEPGENQAEQKFETREQAGKGARGRAKFEDGPSTPQPEATGKKFKFLN